MGNSQDIEQCPGTTDSPIPATFRSKSLGGFKKTADELLVHDRLNVFVIAEAEA